MPTFRFQLEGPFNRKVPQAQATTEHKPVYVELTNQRAPNDVSPRHREAPAPPETLQTARGVPDISRSA